MVEEIETATRVQAAGLSVASNANHSATYSPAKALTEAISDAIVLSAQARQVIDQLRHGQTVAEAWLDHVTAPPDLNKPDTSPSRDHLRAATSDDAQSQAVVKQAVSAAMADLSWLLDAMSPPKVDANRVAQVLARRMALDNLGVMPPLPEVRATAEATGGAAALYVENLSITVQKGTVTEASVDRMALTTVDASLRDRVAGSDRPVVVDVGGQAQLGDKGQSAAEALLGAEETRKKAAEDTAHALLILRQGGNRHPEGTVRLKLDALLPLG